MKNTNKKGTMRTTEEIKDYLMLNNHLNTEETNNKLIKDAQKVEEKYYKEIQSGKYEYACECDFINSPFILEDEDENIKLIKIDQIGGIIVYKTIKN